MIPRNESFICIICGQQVEALHSGGYRNHCPYCLSSLHVDTLIPGDRASMCGGIMHVVELDFKMSGSSRLLFQCEKCGKLHWNKTAVDDDLVQLLS